MGTGNRWITAAQILAALGLGGFWLRAAVDQPDRGGCETVIHVTEADVDIFVDDRAFRIGARRHAPLVVDLPPGEHILSMSRGDATLYEERFTLLSGTGAVLTAWDPRRLATVADEAVAGCDGATDSGDRTPDD